MNYLMVIAKGIYLLANPGEYTIPENEQPMYLAYALLCLAKGEETTSKDVHDAWSLWATLTHGQHKSLIPFAELTPEVQAYDDLYRDAIHTVARNIDNPELY